MSSVALPAVHQREGRGPQEGQKNEMYGEMTLSALSTHRKGTLTPLGGQEGGSWVLAA